MTRIIQCSGRMLEIIDRKYSFKEDMFVCRIRFILINNNGRGIPTYFSHTTNFDDTFLDAFVESAKQFYKENRHAY